MSQLIDRDAVPAVLPVGVRVERRRGGDRRRLTLRSFLQGGLNPRRRGGRRAGEQHLPVDWHEPYLFFLSLTILLLSLADAFLTITLIMGGAQEANPLLAYVLRDRPEWFAVIKMGLTGGGVLVLVAMARSRLFRIMRVALILQGIFVVYVALIAYEWWLLRTLL
ncbi:MAG TPA: DUF5658 family protein [Gammaproteobacteria bacterium]|nr:DUF5658 family protein [Gammaproteobacteria bacterium]